MLAFVPRNEYALFMASSVPKISAVPDKIFRFCQHSFLLHVLSAYLHVNALSEGNLKSPFGVGLNLMLGSCGSRSGGR